MSTNFALTTFSKSGNLTGVEHAKKAALKGETSIAVKAANGLILISAKTDDKFIDTSLLRKTVFPHTKIAMTYSGLSCDFIMISSEGFKIANDYYQKYEENIPTHLYVKKLGKYVHSFTKSGGVRPFGICLLIAGISDDETSLYLMDPSGSSVKLKAAATGNNAADISERLYRSIKGMKEEIEESANDELLDISDCLYLGLNVFKEFNSGIINSKLIEVSVITESDASFRILNEMEINNIIKNLE